MPHRSPRLTPRSRRHSARTLRRRSEDKNNADIYEKAKQQIYITYARQRQLLEEKTAEEVAQLNIALTTDEVAKIEAVRAEEFRKADAEVKLGVKTQAEGERAKTLADLPGSPATCGHCRATDRGQR